MRVAHRFPSAAPGEPPHNPSCGPRCPARTSPESELLTVPPLTTFAEPPAIGNVRCSCGEINLWSNHPHVSLPEFSGPCDRGNPTRRLPPRRAEGFPGSHGPAEEDANALWLTSG